MSDTATNENAEVQDEEQSVELQGIKNSNDPNTQTQVPMRELHGRRQIFTNEREITGKNVVKVLNDALDIHRRNRAEEEYLEKYLRGIQPILQRIKKYHDEINNKVVVNVANQIVTFKTAEFAGEPIQYVSRGSKKSVPKKVEKLNSMMLSESKQPKDMDLAYKMFTSGVGYRLVLRDKATGSRARQSGQRKLWKQRYTISAWSLWWNIRATACTWERLKWCFRSWMRTT